MYGAFFRRFAVLLGMLFLIWTAGSFVVFTLVSRLLGAVGAPSEAGQLVWVIRILPLPVVFVGFALTFRALRRVATPVNLDGTRVREVLANLIANAPRYTPRGDRFGCAPRSSKAM